MQLALVPQAGADPISYTEFSLPGSGPEDSITPVLIEGDLTISGFFIRGDANGDKRVSISDVVSILYNLFVNNPPAWVCRDAADVDDNDSNQVGDAIYLTNYIFRQGPSPPAPTTCGLDPGTVIDMSDCVRVCN